MKYGYKINKPKIYTYQDYLDFYSVWKVGIKRLNKEIRRGKKLRRERQRAGLPASIIQRKLAYHRLMARKMYQLLEEARIEARMRKESERKLKEELARYPISFDKCRDVVFHFNKGYLMNPNIPMWIVKTKGKTFYVNHVDAVGVPWSTKETPDNTATKGSIKFKNVSLSVDGDANAIIRGIGS